MVDLLVTETTFIPASDRDEKAGLLGYISLVRLPDAADQGHQLTRGSAELPAAREHLLEPRPGHVVAVEVEVVEEEQRGALPLLPEPAQALLTHAAGGAFRLLDLRHALVEVEAASEAVAATQEGHVHDGAGGEARTRQRLGQRLHARGDPHALLPGAVPVGIETRQQRGMGGQRPRGGRPCLLEDDRRGGEGVQVGRRRRLVPVCAQVVGAQRVDRDEQDGARGLGRARPTAGEAETSDRDPGRDRQARGLTRGPAGTSAA